MDNKAKLKNNAIEFLHSKKLAVVSTLTEDNEPQGATVFYVVDDNLDFYFVTRKQTRKFKNIQNNPKVGIVVGAELAPATIQIQGKAELLENSEVEKVVKGMLGKFDFIETYLGPFISIPGMDFAVFRVKINWMRYLYFDFKKMSENYCQIIPEES